MREVCYQVHAILQSGYRDLNSGPLAPKASALAKLSHTPKNDFERIFLQRFNLTQQHLSQSTLSKSVFILLNPLSLIILRKPRIVLLSLIYILPSLLRFQAFVKMISHLLHIYYNKFFIKNQVIFQTIFFICYVYIISKFFEKIN